MLLVLFSTFFFLRDGRKIWRFIVRLFPVNARWSLADAGDASWATLGSYVRATVLVAFIDAVGIGLALVILKIPFPFPLAALVFLGAFIPIVGASVSGAVAVLVALVDQGWVVALIVLGAVILVQQVEGHVLQPLIMGRAVAIHPLVVIVGIASRRGAGRHHRGAGGGAADRRAEHRRPSPGPPPPGGAAGRRRGGPERSLPMTCTLMAAPDVRRGGIRVSGSRLYGETCVSVRPRLTLDADLVDAAGGVDGEFAVAGPAQRPQRPRPGRGEEPEHALRRGHDLGGELAGAVEQPDVRAADRLTLGTRCTMPVMTVSFSRSTPAGRGADWSGAAQPAAMLAGEVMDHAFPGSSPSAIGTPMSEPYSVQEPS